ncbi:MAG: dihydropteroate synthase-like protein [Desulfurococcaceae archaeon]
MKLVLITGRLAYKQVKELADEVMKKYPGIEIKIVELPIQVAAMITDEYLLKTIPSYIDKLLDADLIVVPGLTRGDMSRVSYSIGKKVVKGPRYASDIPLFIDALINGIIFSPVYPADDVLENTRSEIFEKTINELKEEARRDYYFLVHDLPVSKHYPLVILEIYIDNPVDLRNQIKAAKYADLVSIGVPCGYSDERIISILKEARKLLNKPIGIDTFSVDSIRNIYKVVDFINGILVEDVEKVINMRGELQEIPIVVVGTSKNSVQRVSELKEAVRLLVESNFRKVIVDPTLLPPFYGLVESIKAYILSRQEMINTPLLMGVGNVTELVDVDSIGVNALLAFIGVEIGVELYLTTESSVKTRGSTKEVRKALDMALVARKFHRPPKDIGKSLLVVKDKKKHEIRLPRASSLIYATNPYQETKDPCGYFKIAIDHESRELIVQHYDHGKEEPDLEIRGKDPFHVLNEIVSRKLASQSDHYFYLGYELAKAKIALDLGKEYTQDEDLFKE